MYRAVEDMADGGAANTGATAGGGEATGAARAAPVLRISPETQVLRNNLIFNINFNGPSCGSIGFDLDDESSQYVHTNWYSSIGMWDLHCDIRTVCTICSKTLPTMVCGGCVCVYYTCDVCVIR